MFEQGGRHTSLYNQRTCTHGSSIRSNRGSKDPSIKRRRVYGKTLVDPSFVMDKGTNLSPYIISCHIDHMQENIMFY